MFKDVILGLVALAMLLGIIGFSYDTAEADERFDRTQILTKDYVYIGAENEDGVSVTVMPPSEEIMAEYR
ncbi:MAG: hypothetical protein GY771_10225 [bacterium]|nr:hypothetical protein [bacterium]